jgi:hypothetical protein
MITYWRNSTVFITNPWKLSSRLRSWKVDTRTNTGSFLFYKIKRKGRKEGRKKERKKAGTEYKYRKVGSIFQIRIFRGHSTKGSNLHMHEYSTFRKMFRSKQHMKKALEDLYRTPSIVRTVKCRNLWHDAQCFFRWGHKKWIQTSVGEIWVCWEVGTWKNKKQYLGFSRGRIWKFMFPFVLLNEIIVKYVVRCFKQ